MLIIRVYVNKEIIGCATAENVSALAVTSDYEVAVTSESSHVTDLKLQTHKFSVVDHVRKQSAWALVAKIAGEAARRDNAALAIQQGREDLMNRLRPKLKETIDALADEHNTTPDELVAAAKELLSRASR